MTVDDVGRISLELSDDLGVIDVACVEPYVWPERSAAGYVVGTPYSSGYLITVLTTQPLTDAAVPPWTPLQNVDDGLFITTYDVANDDALAPIVSPLHAQLVGNILSARARPATAPTDFAGQLLDVR